MHHPNRSVTRRSVAEIRNQLRTLVVICRAASQGDPNFAGWHPNHDGTYTHYTRLGRAFVAGPTVRHAEDAQRFSALSVELWQALERDARTEPARARA